LFLIYGTKFCIFDIKLFSLAKILDESQFHNYRFDTKLQITLKNFFEKNMHTNT